MQFFGSVLDNNLGKLTKQNETKATWKKRASDLTNERGCSQTGVQSISRPANQIQRMPKQSFVNWMALKCANSTDLLINLFRPFIHTPCARVSVAKQINGRAKRMEAAEWEWGRKKIADRDHYDTATFTIMRRVSGTPACVCIFAEQPSPKVPRGFVWQIWLFLIRSLLFYGCSFFLSLSLPPSFSRSTFLSLARSWFVCLLKTMLPICAQPKRLLRVDLYNWGVEFCLNNLNFILVCFASTLFGQSFGFFPFLFFFRLVLSFFL